MASPQRGGVKTPSPEELARTLAMLNQPDNEVIARATAIMRKFMKTSHCVGPMLIQIDRCPNARVRQMASVLLRPKIGRFWRKLPANMQMAAKGMLLQKLSSEPERAVRLANAALIAAIAKRDLPDNKWNELLPKLSELMKDDDKREMALLLFQALAETVGSSLRKHRGNLRDIFIGALRDQNKAVRLQAVRALGVIVDFHRSNEEIQKFRQAIPMISALIGECVKDSDEQALGQILTVLENMIETSSAIMTQSIPQLIGQVGAIAADVELDIGLREKACNFLVTLIKDKPGKVVSSDMCHPILQLAFRMATEQTEDNPFESTEITAHRLSCELLDTAMNYLPSRICFGYVLENCSKLIKSQNPFHIKGGLTFLGAMSDASKDELSESPNLPNIVQAVAQYISHDNILVRTAACFAMSQLADGLSEALNEMHRQILPALFKVLDRDAKESPSVMLRACHAVEGFCDSLGPEMKPYLPKLMDSFGALMGHRDNDIKVAALRLLSAVALAAKADFVEFLPKVCEQVLMPLMQRKEEDLWPLRARATECAGAVAVGVGKVAFQQYLQPMITAVMDGFGNVESFEVREASFSFFGYLACVLKGDMNHMVKSIVDLAAATLMSDDGLSISRQKSALGDEDAPDVLGSDDEDEDDDQHGANGAGGGDDDDDDEDENDDIGQDDLMRGLSFSIRTGALDEKCSALACLAALAEHCCRAFAEHLPLVMLQLMDQTQYPNESIRFSAVQCLDEILGCMKQLAPLANPWVPGKAAQVEPRALGVVRAVMSLLWVSVGDEEDKEVVCAACKAIERALKDWGVAAIDCTNVQADACLLQIVKQCDQFDQQEYEQLRDAFAKEDQQDALSKVLGRIVVDLMHQRTQCQRFREDDADDRVQLDHDNLLDYAVDVLVALCQAMGPPSFGLFRACLPPLREFMLPEKPVHDISMALGCIADCVKCFGPEQLAQQGFPAGDVAEIVVLMLQHKDGVNRRNAAFCLGVLVQQCVGGFNVNQLQKFLLDLRPLLAAPSVELQSDLAFLGIRDNAVSAMCRVLMGLRTVSAEAADKVSTQVIPVIMSNLPLVGDVEEAETVYPLVLEWMRMGGFVSQHVVDLVRTFAHALAEPKIGMQVKRPLARAALALLNPANGVNEAVRGHLDKLPRAHARAFMEAAQAAATPANSPQKQ